MTVHLAGTLPTGNTNGLPAVERKLIEGHLKRTAHIVVGVVYVSGTKGIAKEGFAPNPTIAFEHIEVLPPELIEQGRALLQDAYTARSGQTTLDLPEDDDEGDEVAPQLALTQVAGEYTVRVASGEPGRWSVAVYTASGALAISRHSLTDEDVDLAAGSYTLADIADTALGAFAATLIREYEDSMTLADDVEDAEVVEDDE